VVFRNRQFILRSLVDLVEIVYPLPKPPKRADTRRILIFNWRDTRHSWAGGAEVYVHELAKRWVGGGHHVTVFCGNDGRLPRREIIDGVHMVRRGGFYLVYFWAFAYYLVRFRGRYDVILDCHNGIPFFTPLYAKEPVIGVVHHIHQVVVRRQVPGARLIIAGSGEDASRLQQLSADLQLSDGIEFKARVSDAGKISLLQSAWVFVNPSLMEGWGITTIEANACGTPVVGSNVSGLRDSIRTPDTGFLTPHGDHEALANRITDLLTNHDQRASMSAKALDWSHRFDWDTSSARALKLIQDEAH
jgi:hypothetical protein